ncbi:MAG: helix-turn-helix domain-containing protein [[Eubacterium] siraeum]
MYRRGEYGTLSEITDLREDADKTQQEIADYLGTSAQHYGKYESGKAEIPLERAVRLLNIIMSALIISQEFLKPPPSDI